MPDYSQILDSELEVRDPGTTSLFARLRDNAEAIATGGSGAPQFQTDAFDAAVVTGAKIGNLAVDTGHIVALAVTNAKLASNAVKQPNLVVVSTDAFVATAANTSLSAGGEFLFFPKIKNGMFIIAAGASNTTAAAYIHCISGSGAQGIRYTYVSASPPYDLGDGEAALFAFVELLDGAARQAWASIEPPWAHAGPTPIHVDFYHEGRPYQLRRAKPCALREAFGDPEKMQACLDALATGEWSAVEVTQAVKNADMPLIPHPFVESKHERSKVVLIDPVSEIAAELALLQSMGESVSDLIREGVVVLGQPVERHGPPGVTVVSAHWRNS